MPFFDVETDLSVSSITVSPPALADFSVPFQETINGINRFQYWVTDGSFPAWNPADDDD
ncbi:MAG: hypothetical protein V3V05_12305 [Pontiella sp.]